MDIETDSSCPKRKILNVIKSGIITSLGFEKKPLSAKQELWIYTPNSDKVNIYWGSLYEIFNNE